MKALEILQLAYDSGDIESFFEFFDLFKSFYDKADTAEKLALLLHFICEWYDEDYADLVNELR